MRCVIVDDNEAFLLDARHRLTREGLEIVGMARTVEAALETIAACRPELALVDIDLGEGSGFEVVRALDDARDGVRAILISAHAELDFADLIEACPAAGFLSKLDLSAAAIRDLLAR